MAIQKIHYFIAPVACVQFTHQYQENIACKTHRFSKYDHLPLSFDAQNADILTGFQVSSTPKVDKNRTKKVGY